MSEARARIAAAGLADRVEVRFEDYRDTAGTFDRLVSIEMIEAVGEENWPVFFRTIAERLCPDGLAVIQAITIREDAFAQYRQNPDFIQRYIFPGGMLPTVELMRERAGEAGLTFETIERFGASYALTLAEWRRRFEAAWPEIAGAWVRRAVPQDVALLSDLLRGRLRAWLDRCGPLPLDEACVRAPDFVHEQRVRSFYDPRRAGRQCRKT